MLHLLHLVCHTVSQECCDTESYSVWERGKGRFMKESSIESYQTYMSLGSSWDKVVGIWDGIWEKSPSVFPLCLPASKDFRMCPPLGTGFWRIGYWREHFFFRRYYFPLLFLGVVYYNHTCEKWNSQVERIHVKNTSVKRKTDCPWEKKIFLLTTGGNFHTGNFSPCSLWLFVYMLLFTSYMGSLGCIWACLFSCTYILHYYSVIENSSCFACTNYYFLLPYGLYQIDEMLHPWRHSRPGWM